MKPNLRPMNCNISQFLDKTFVLTIKRNAERHPHVAQVLKGVDFDYWYGLDAPTVFHNKKYVSEIDDQFFLDNDVDKGYVSRLSLGQFGAYFSIKKMIGHIVNAGFERTLIFEDDLMPLQKDWERIFCQSIVELPHDWDILFLGYVYDGPLYKQYYHRRFRFLLNAYYRLKPGSNKYNFTRHRPSRYSRNLDFSGYCMGGHAYCLSKKGARLINSYLSPMRDSGDVLISQLILEKKIKAFSVYPCLFAQDRDRFGSKTRI